MKGIDTSTAVPDMYGPGAAGFRDGDPLSGTPATRLNATWFNGVQQEILNAITDGGLTPDAEDLTQLAQAIRSRVGKHTGEVFYYPGRTPPYGAVVADGGLVRRDMYPDLWKFAEAQNLVVTESDWQKQTGTQGSVGVYSSGDGTTTFRLPLLTDYFRGTADPAKVGTWQGDAIRNITGTLYGLLGGAYVAPTGIAKSTEVTGVTLPADNPSGNGRYRHVNLDASLVVPTASENRPKTLFLLPCIHAYSAVIPDAQANMHGYLAALNLKEDRILRLTADTTVYVRTTGSDDNDGLTASTPLATVERAWRVIESWITGRYIVTINLGPGVWPEITVPRSTATLAGLVIEGAGSAATTISPGPNAFGLLLGHTRSGCTVQKQLCASSCAKGILVIG